MIRIFIAFASLILSISFTPRTICADVIELQGGDIIHADVIKITTDVLTIRHKIFGEVDIPRDQIRGIVLGKTKPGARAIAGGDPNRGAGAKDSEQKQETPKEVIDRLVNKEFGPKAVEKLERGTIRQPTAEDAVEQLRIEGVDPKLRSSLHLMLPGFGTPEVQGYFDSRVNGLIDGSMTIQDIRKDAIGARDQLKEIMDDLGADGAALQGYFSILDNFIKKTAPPETKTEKPVYEGPTTR